MMGVMTVSVRCWREGDGWGFTDGGYGRQDSDEGVHRWGIKMAVRDEMRE